MSSLRWRWTRRRRCARPSPARGYARPSSELRARLAADADPMVRAACLRHCSDDILRTLARDPSERVRAGVAGSTRGARIDDGRVIEALAIDRSVVVRTYVA